MNIFKRQAKSAGAEVERFASAVEEELKIFEMSILDRAANATDNVLDKASTYRDRLQSEIKTLEDTLASRLEELRHTDLVIATMKAAQAALVAGSDPAPVVAAAPAVAEPQPSTVDTVGAA